MQTLCQKDIYSWAVFVEEEDMLEELREKACEVPAIYKASTSDTTARLMVDPKATCKDHHHTL
jgi:hypothetical protein